MVNLIPLRVILDGDGAFPELEHMTPAELLIGSDITLAILERGTASGAPSIAIKIVCDNGQTVFAQSTYKLFLTAMDAMKARYGDPR